MSGIAIREESKIFYNKYNHFEKEKTMISR